MAYFALQIGFILPIFIFTLRRAIDFGIKSLATRL